MDGFIGRRRELTEARRLLESHRLVTVVGPGGVGKTRLALRVAARAGRSFADGAHLADLSGLENGLLLGDVVLQALGVVDQSSRPAASVLAEHLAQRRLPLVLDNCEHLIDACADLMTVLLRTVPELRVLATSREPLCLPGEALLELAPVSVDDAVLLFEERARTVQPGFAVTPDNRDTVVELCRRLDHLPLAIELAAARLRVLSPVQILDRLDDEFRLLARRARDNPRHASIQASLAWSAQTCSKPERVLWARASVFAVDFDLDAAEHVCADRIAPAEDILELLTGLVNKSILAVRRDGPVVRYAWLDTLRAYGHHLLAERGEVLEFRRRHCDFFRGLTGPLVTITDSVQEFGRALQRLRRERANVRAALDFCLTEPGEARAGLDLAGRLAIYWLSSATLGEGRQWLRRALDASGDPGPERTRALWACGWIATEQGDLAEAEHLLAEAREQATEVGDEPDLAWATALAGYAALFAGDLDRSRSLLEDGLAHQERLGNVRGMLPAMSGLAQTTSYLGDVASETISRQALALAEQHELDAARSSALRTLGLELVRQGRVENATDALRQALRWARQLDFRYGIANCLEFLAWAAQCGGRPETAAQLLGAARAAYRRIGATMPRPQRDCDERYARQMRQALGDQRFTAAHSHGEALSLQQAIRYALAEAGPVAAPPPSAPSLLTPRERQVAGLVARGLSAKDIAAELVISARTAETHVAHILTKLGFTSRAQIAAWVAQQPWTDT